MPLSRFDFAIFGACRDATIIHYAPWLSIPTSQNAGADAPRSHTARFTQFAPLVLRTDTGIHTMLYKKMPPP